MNLATKISTIVIAIYAGLLGMIHGVFEILQGNNKATGLLINAIGIDFESQFIWLEGLPAFSILLNFLASGIIAIIVSLAVFLYALIYINNNSCKIILVILSILMFLFGAGFIPPFLCLIAAIISQKINKPINFKFNSDYINLILIAKLWIWVLCFYILWIIGEWILGYFYPNIILKHSFLFFLIKLVLPFLLFFTGLAYDYRKSKSSTTN
ncbi:hypothetical protein ACFLTE_06730 [Bacteroidota bacterium]